MSLLITVGVVDELAGEVASLTSRSFAAVLKKAHSSR